MAFDTVIGLEVHVQLNTKSKLFSASSTQFGEASNTQTSFIDAGLPGVLPVLNAEVVKKAALFGLAINATINDNSYFERKNYFYPDLPKGYQISQLQAPIVTNGYLAIELSNGSTKKIAIERAHIEEDAGKSIHAANADFSGIDLNRAGTPLLEIVTTPCLYSAEEAVLYLKALHTLVRFLDICDGNMQEGSFRCDVNISLKPEGTTVLGTRVELKNLNSFRFIEKAIQFEERRQADLLLSNEKIVQETRLYDPNSDTTQTMRLKENENDYRYFPDPDLLPIKISADDLEKIKAGLHLLPETIKANLQKIDGVTEEDVLFLLSSPATYRFYEGLKKAVSLADDKLIINWLKNNYLASLNDAGLSFEKPPVTIKTLAPLLDLLAEKKISSKIAKEVFIKLWVGETSVEDIIKREGLLELTDNSLLEQVVKKLIEIHPEQAEDYRNGKEKLLAFFVGLAMKETKGKANAAVLNELFKTYLNN